MSTAATPVAVHPERTDDPFTVRWHVAGGVEATDDAVRADPYLAQLLAAGVLSAVSARADGISTTLGVGHGWAGVGTVVREAVQHAVASVRSGATQADRDAALAELAARVVREETGPYAESHGGSITVLEVSDGVVRVRMDGACRGCPAANLTVQARLVQRLRTAAPWLVDVRIENGTR